MVEAAKEKQKMATKVEEEDEEEKAMKLWKAFHELNMDPSVESKQDLEKFLKGYAKRQGDQTAPMAAPPNVTPTVIQAPAATNPQATTTGFPKISTFYGDGKGETSCETYRFEIQALIDEKVYKPEQIMLGVRRSVRGPAADILRRLGTGVTIEDVIKKFNGTFGSTNTKDTIRRKLFSCTQDNDTVTAFATKLEELFAQGVEFGVVKKGDDECLRELLYQGLKIDFRLMAQYKFQTVLDYDAFKIELRQLEDEMNVRDQKRKTCHVAQKTQEGEQIGKLQDTVQQLQDKIKKLEEEKDNPPVNQPHYYYGSRGFRRGTGRFRGNRGRGRGQYKPTRPIAINTMRGACYRCGERGHIAKDCPVDYRELEVECYRCGEKGHYAKRCQADYKEIQKKKNNLNE